MTGPRINVGGGAALMTGLKRANEMDPYDENYHYMSLHAGVEFPVVDTVDKVFLGGPQVGVQYGYTGGDEGNLGSHMHDFSFYAGWRQNLTPYIFLSPRAGVAYTQNTLGFGKNIIPVPKSESMNVNMTAAGGVQYCTGDMALCVGLEVGYFFNQSVFKSDDQQPYYRQHGVFLGLVTSNDLTVYDEKRQCEQDYLNLSIDFGHCYNSLKDDYAAAARVQQKLNDQTEQNKNLFAQINAIIERFQGVCGSFSQEPSLINQIVPLMPTLIDLPTKRLSCEESTKILRQSLEKCLSTHHPGSRQDLANLRSRYESMLSQEEKNHEILVTQLNETINEAFFCGVDKGAEEMPRVILFANDNPDIPLQPQWYAAQRSGQLFGNVEDGRFIPCFSNPVLDFYILQVNKIVDSYEAKKDQGNDVAKPTFQFILTGVANETGNTERNKHLALARAKSVWDYLKGSPAESRLSDTDRIKNAERVAELKKHFDPNYPIRSVCGSVDEDGNPYPGLDSPKFAPYMAQIDIRQAIPSKGKDPTIESLRQIYSPRDPLFRMVILEFKVIVEGKHLKGKELRDYLNTLI